MPPTSSDADGGVEVTVNQINNKLTWEIEYEDLTGAAKAAHFHGPATNGQNANVALPINGNLTSPIKGEATLTPA